MGLGSSDCYGVYHSLSLALPTVFNNNNNNNQLNNSVIAHSLLYMTILLVRSFIGTLTRVVGRPVVGTITRDLLGLLSQPTQRTC